MLLKATYCEWVIYTYVVVNINKPLFNYKLNNQNLVLFLHTGYCINSLSVHSVRLHAPIRRDGLCRLQSAGEAHSETLRHKT
jgi:hypothetical protein